MHVAHLAWEHPPRLWGGLGRHVGALTRELAALGVQVSVITPHLDGPEDPPVGGVTVVRAEPPPAPLPPEHWVAEVLDANRAMVDAAVRLWKRQGLPELLHVHDWMAWPATEALCERFGLPVVATVHATERGRHMGHLPPGPSAWIDGQERMMVTQARRVIVCSRPMRDAVADTLHVDVEDLDVAGNGVDLEAWGRDGIQREADLVVFAGRLEHEKGVDLLLEATEGVAVRLVIAGDGTAAADLRERAAAPPSPEQLLGPRRRTDFVGRLGQDDLAELLNRAMIVVVPSRYEPFGLVALEGLAAGATVVASAVGGLPGILGDAGILVRPGDVPGLRDAIRRALASPVDAERARARAAQFSWTAVAERVVASYGRSLGGWADD